MDIILLLKTLLMGVVEGVTEFLPVSSTGHLIIVGDAINFLDKDRRDVFELTIQFAAILAVCWEYRARLIPVARGVFSQPPAQRFVLNLFIAFLPAALIGLLFEHAIKQHLFQPVPVAIAFIAGGLVILWAEKRQHVVRVQEVDQMTPLDALKVGCAQCLALFPGTSRSGATIIGGLLFGLSRKAATEFSFFLAIPVLFAVTVHEVWKNRQQFHGQDIDILLLGSLASFVSAFFAIRALIRYISRHDFTPFAWYRIGFGALILLLAWRGMLDWSA